MPILPPTKRAGAAGVFRRLALRRDLPPPVLIIGAGGRKAWLLFSRTEPGEAATLAGLPGVRISLISAAS